LTAIKFRFAHPFQIHSQSQRPRAIDRDQSPARSFYFIRRGTDLTDQPWSGAAHFIAGSSTANGSDANLPSVAWVLYQLQYGALCNFGGLGELLAPAPGITNEGSPGTLHPGPE
jgi:hypothetical protein